MITTALFVVTCALAWRAAGASLLSDLYSPVNLARREQKFHARPEQGNGPVADGACFSLTLKFIGVRKEPLFPSGTKRIRGLGDRSARFHHPQPDSQAAMEEAVDIHIDVRAVLRQLGEVRQMLDHLRQAEALAERLKDDRRRGSAVTPRESVRYFTHL
jgi:hypothetical protein